MAKSITGREPERAVLDQVLESDSAELVARRNARSEDLIDRVVDAKALF